MKTVTIPLYECLRCSWEWMPRTRIKTLPKVCPKCKNPNWNKEKLSTTKSVTNPDTDV